MKKKSATKTKPLPDTLSYSQARSNLSELMRRVCEDRAAITITRKNAEPAVLISLEDYRAIEETSYLLKSPANAARLAASLKGIADGAVKEHTLVE